MEPRPPRPRLSRIDGCIALFAARYPNGQPVDGEDEIAESIECDHRRCSGGREHDTRQRRSGERGQTEAHAFQGVRLPKVAIGDRRGK